MFGRDYERFAQNITANCEVFDEQTQETAKGMKDWSLKVLIDLNVSIFRQCVRPDVAILRRVLVGITEEFHFKDRYGTRLEKYCSFCSNNSKEASLRTILVVLIHLSRTRCARRSHLFLRLGENLDSNIVQKLLKSPLEDFMNGDQAQ